MCRNDYHYSLPSLENPDLNGFFLLLFPNIFISLCFTFKVIDVGNSSREMLDDQIHNGSN